MDLVKKHLIFIVLILGLHLPFTVYSQVEMEKVLIEMGTATWSNASALEVELINDMQEEGLNISIINYHLNDDYSNQSGNLRASYYNIQSLPFPVVGGKNVIAGSAYSYHQAYEESLNTPSSFTISSSGHFVEDTLFLDVFIDKTFAYESDSISLYIALTESDIQEMWYGQTDVDYVERVMLPNGNGRDLDFSENSLLQLHEKVLFPSVWNPGNMELLVFLQNDTSKKILQCHARDINDFAPLPVHAFFSASDTMICEGNTISFQNESTGNIDNLHWFFEGGTPAESTDLNPVVQYSVSGVYPVSLLVSNAVSTDTLTIQDFSHINEVPDITFDIFPEFCHDQEKYFLVEGHPYSGTYYGLFVDTGYFHPEAAGVGEHEVFYTCENETTHCADTVSQIAYVYICEGIDEERQEYQDFPYHITKENQSLVLSLKAENDLQITEVQLYNVNGQLLFKRDLSAEDSKDLTFSLNSYNSLYIIRVYTTKKAFIVKIL